MSGKIISLISGILIFSSLKTFAIVNAASGLQQGINELLSMSNVVEKTVTILCGICGLFGAFTIFKKMTSGDHEATRSAVSWIMGIIYISAAIVALKALFF